MWEGKFPPNLNNIYKCGRDVSSIVKDLWHIFLCNVVYKIVSKVLCNRLCRVIPKIFVLNQLSSQAIHPWQCYNCIQNPSYNEKYKQNLWLGWLDFFIKSFSRWVRIKMGSLDKYVCLHVVLFFLSEWQVGRTC